MAELFGPDFMLIAAALAGLLLTTLAILRDVGTSRLALPAEMAPRVPGGLPRVA